MMIEIKWCKYLGISELIKNKENDDRNKGIRVSRVQMIVKGGRWKTIKGAILKDFSLKVWMSGWMTKEEKAIRRQIRIEDWRSRDNAKGTNHCFRILKDMPQGKNDYDKWKWREIEYFESKGHWSN